LNHLPITIGIIYCVFTTYLLQSRPLCTCLRPPRQYNNRSWKIPTTTITTFAPPRLSLTKQKATTGGEDSSSQFHDRSLEQLQDPPSPSPSPHNDTHDNNSNNSVGNNNQNNELSVWMLEQRRLKKYSELSTKRVELLNDIDFVWEPQTTNWLTMYDKLCLYATQKQQQQAANDVYDDDDDDDDNLSGSDGGGVGQWNYAPSRSPTSSDPDLGLWCHSQRRSYKRKTLSKERIQYLNSIDFVWEV